MLVFISGQNMNQIWKNTSVPNLWKSVDIIWESHVDRPATLKVIIKVNGPMYFSSQLYKFFPLICPNLMIHNDCGPVKNYYVRENKRKQQYSAVQENV